MSETTSGLTVIVPTLNEEQNLEACLASVRWADQVIVVDSHSTDRTREIAHESGAEVQLFTYDGGWPKKKNWALRNLSLRNDWVLILDADERVDRDLQREIQHVIASDTSHVGFYVRWKFMFLGEWMRWSWRDGWMLRLFRRGAGEYEDLGMRGEGGWDNEVHENIVVEGTTGRLNEWLRHESRQDLSFWLGKQNQFSDWNAARRLRQAEENEGSIGELFAHDPLKRRKAMKRVFLRLPGKPVVVFFYLYLFRLGFLDGKAGLYFCALRAAHELNVVAKIFELEQGRRAGPID